MAIPDVGVGDPLFSLVVACWGIWMYVVWNQHEKLQFYWLKTHCHCKDISDEQTVISAMWVTSKADTNHHCQQSNNKQLIYNIPLLLIARETIPLAGAGTSPKIQRAKGRIERLQVAMQTAKELWTNSCCLCQDSKSTPMSSVLLAIVMTRSIETDG